MIRGDKNDYAVLCSKDKTYDMKIADTSNTLLFIPGCGTPEQLSTDTSSSNVTHVQVFILSQCVIFWSQLQVMNYF